MWPGERDRRRPPQRTEGERHGRQRVEEERERGDIGFAAVLEADPRAHLAVVRGLTERPTDRRRVDPDVDPVKEADLLGETTAGGRGALVRVGQLGRRLLEVDRLTVGVEVGKRGRMPQAHLVVLAHRDLGGREGAADAQDLGGDGGGAGLGGGEEGRAEGDDVGVGACRLHRRRGGLGGERHEHSAVDGFADHPAVGEFCGAVGDAQDIVELSHVPSVCRPVGGRVTGRPVLRRRLVTQPPTRARATP